MLTFEECLREAANALNFAANNINPDEFEKSLNLISKSLTKNSKIIVSGVGKSGIVARKLASTFTSVGMTSIYLNPLDALHGDLGIVHKTDVCLFLSNSGDTEELLEIIPYIKKRGSKIISIAGNSESKLFKLSDAFILARINRELCPLNLAPTASTTVAMAIGDAIAAVWMNREKISAADFALNHPGGSLGKTIYLKVSDLMIPRDKIKLLSPDDTFKKVIKAITNDGIGIACVHDTKNKHKILGIITDGDVRRTLDKHPPSKWEFIIAKNIMTKSPVIISPNELAITGLQIMENNNKPITDLPVVDKNNLILGILRMHDIVNAGLKIIN